MEEFIKQNVDINKLVEAYYFLYKLGDNCTTCCRENEHQREYVRVKACELFIETNKIYQEKKG